MLGKCSNLQQLHAWYKIYCNALHLPKSEKTICFFDVHVSCKNWKRGNWVLRTHCWKKKRPQSLPQWKWLLDQKPSSSPIFVIIVTFIIIIFLFESWKQASNGASVWRRKTLSRHGIKSDLYKKCNCTWLFKLDKQDLLTEMNKNESLFTPRYFPKIIQISPWPLRFLRSDPWDIGKLGVDGQGPTSFSVPRPLHTSLTSSSSSHYLSTFISPTLSSSPTLPSRHQTSVLMEKSIRHWFVTICLLWILCFLGLLRLLLQDEVSLALCGSDFLSITRWWIAQQLRHK